MGSSAAAGKWEIPDGHIEEGETAAVGAQREREEDATRRLPKPLL
jgi:ADP-ribose pyrophosphatase YjhB (NUDIX family)